MSSCGRRLPGMAGMIRSRKALHERSSCRSGRSRRKPQGSDRARSPKQGWKTVDGLTTQRMGARNRQRSVDTSRSTGGCRLDRPRKGSIFIEPLPLSDECNGIEPKERFWATGWLHFRHQTIKPTPSIYRHTPPSSGFLHFWHRHRQPLHPTPILLDCAGHGNPLV